ncbi:MAG: tyrosine-protein phosphatase [Actinocatenispora sp.]
MVEPVARSLRWPDCRNVRDLGGLPTSDGHRIRRGALIRADNLDRLTPDGLAALHAAGVRRVIDLRTGRETRDYPHPLARHASYLHAPLIDEEQEKHRDPASEPTLAEIYRGSIGRNARSITAGLVAFADAPPGAVVVHCHAGKDRTGMYVALALHAAGVAARHIAEDYAYTAHCLRGQIEHDLDDLPDEQTRARLRDLHGSEPGTILGMLEHVDTRYGSVGNYLRGHGMSQRQYDTLRERLREPAEAVTS